MKNAGQAWRQHPIKPPVSNREERRRLSYSKKNLRLREGKTIEEKEKAIIMERAALEKLRHELLEASEGRNPGNKAKRDNKDVSNGMQGAHLTDTVSICRNMGEIHSKDLSQHFLFTSELKSLQLHFWDIHGDVLNIFNYEGIYECQT